MISFDIAGTKGFSARVEMEETLDIEGNCSHLQTRLYILSSGYYGLPYWISGQVTGRTLSSNVDEVYIEKLNAPCPVGDSWEITVQHGDDGTGTVTIALSIRGYSADGNYGSGWKVEGSKTVTLTPIVRASAVSATDGEVGESCAISISRASADYVHTLFYSFGSLSGYITQEGSVTDQPVTITGSAVNWLLPEEFYTQLTHSPGAVCLLSCTTFNGEKQVGQPTQTAFTVTAPERVCRPLLEASVTDIDPQTCALTGDSSVLVRFMSQALCQAEATPQKGALLVDITVEGQAVPATLSGMEAYSFRAVDSRGYASEVTLRPRVIPYILPTVGGICSRIDPKSGSAELTIRGNCWSGSFGAAQNTLTLQLQLEDRVFEVQPLFDGQTYHAAVHLENLRYERGYSLTVTARDALCEATTVITIEPGEPVFDWGQRDFAFHVPVTAPRINGIKNPALKAWPVGAVMLFSADPSATIGGKWERFTLPGIDLDAWRRIQGGDLLGTARLGQMILGTEE